MTLTPRKLRWALYCAGEELRARRAGKPPGVQTWNAELIRALELELAVAMSESGHEFDGDGPELDVWITAREAATMLGLSKRRVQRLAADLDGQIVDGRWVFHRSTVTGYAEWRQHDRLAG